MKEQANVFKPVILKAVILKAVILKAVIIKNNQNISHFSYFYFSKNIFLYNDALKCFYYLKWFMKSSNYNNNHHLALIDKGTAAI